jgi:hypothetical protein
MPDTETELITVRELRVGDIFPSDDGLVHDVTDVQIAAVFARWRSFAREHERTARLRPDAHVRIVKRGEVTAEYVRARTEILTQDQSPAIPPGK